MRLTSNGTIQISENNDAGKGRHLEYEWVGGPIVAISYALLEQESDIIRRNGNFIDVGPFHLRVVGDDIKNPYDRPLFAQAVCVREGPHAWALAAYVRLYNLSTDIWHRIIVTLAVWGLADYHEATIPCLGDIHVVQWLQGYTTERGAA